MEINVTEDGLLKKRELIKKFYVRETPEELRVNNNTKNILFEEESEIMVDLYLMRKEYFEQSLINRQKLKQIREIRNENERKLRVNFKASIPAWNQKRLQHVSKSNINMGLKRKSTIKEKKQPPVEIYMKPPPVLPPLYKQKPWKPEKLDYLKASLPREVTMEEISKSRYLRIPETK